VGPLSIEKLTTINEIPVGGAIAVETGGTPIALVRPNASTVKAVHNCCSHQQYELAPEGWVGDNSIECALHGSTFDLDDGEPSSLISGRPACMTFSSTRGVKKRTLYLCQWPTAVLTA